MLDAAIVATSSGLGHGTIGTAALVYDRSDKALRIQQTRVFTDVSRQEAELQALVSAVRWYTVHQPNVFRSILLISDNPGLVSQGEYGGEEGDTWETYRMLVSGRTVVWHWESRLQHAPLVEVADDARCAAIQATAEGRSLLLAVGNV